MLNIRNFNCNCLEWLLNIKYLRIYAHFNQAHAVFFTFRITCLRIGDPTRFVSGTYRSVGVASALKIEDGRVTDLNEFFPVTFENLKLTLPTSKLSICWSAKWGTQPSRWRMEELSATLGLTSSSSERVDTNFERLLPSVLVDTWLKTSS